jgi:transposase
MKKTRRKFTSEFKEKAAKLMLDEGMTRTKVAHDLGVKINQVSRWVRDYQSRGEDAFPGNGRLSPQDKRIKDLEAEVRQLRMERDILKKGKATWL